MSHLLSVTVYTTPEDVQARHAAAFLAHHAIPHRVVDVTRDDHARERVVAMGFVVAPVVVASTGRAWSGHRPDLLAELVAEVDRMVA